MFLQLQIKLIVCLFNYAKSCDHRKYKVIISMVTNRLKKKSDCYCIYYIMTASSAVSATWLRLFVHRLLLVALMTYGGHIFKL